MSTSPGVIPEDPRRNRTVLLVEDDPNDVELIKRAFKITLFARKLVHAPDGSTALDYLFSRGIYTGRPPGMPEIMILDLGLPGLSGHEVLRQVQADEQAHKIPIVIMTGSSEDEAMVKSFNLGASYFIRKLSDIEQFRYDVLQLELHWMSRGGPSKPF